MAPTTPSGREYFFVLEGSGLHLTEGEPLRLAVGDLVFISKVEWHGFANDTDQPTRVVTIIGGVSHYSDAGYEIHPSQPAPVPGTR